MHTDTPQKGISLFSHMIDGEVQTSDELLTFGIENTHTLSESAVRNILQQDITSEFPLVEAYKSYLQQYIVPQTL